MRHAGFAALSLCAACSSAQSGKPPRVDALDVAATASASSAPHPPEPDVVYAGQWKRLGKLRLWPAYAPIVLLASGEIAAFVSDETGIVVEVFDLSTARSTRHRLDIEPRPSASAVRMSDGRILLAGGKRPVEGADRIASATAAWLVDPRTWRVSAAGELSVGRLLPTLVALPDGRALAISGVRRTHNSDRLEIYEPKTGAFRFGGRGLPTGKPAALPLEDGSVLVIGETIVRIEMGTSGSAPRPVVREVATLGSGYAEPRAVTLRSGRILVVGTTDCRLLDVDGAPVAAPPLPRGVEELHHAGALTVLGDGSALLAGGSVVAPEGTMPWSRELLDTYRFRELTRTWEPAGELLAPAAFVHMFTPSDRHPILVSSTGDVMRYE